MTDGVTLCHAGRDWDRHGDGLVELSPPGLYGNDRAEGCSVAEDSPDHLIGDGLGLGERKKTGHEYPLIHTLLSPSFMTNLLQERYTMFTRKNLADIKQ